MPLSEPTTMWYLLRVFPAAHTEEQAKKFSCVPLERRTNSTIALQSAHCPVSTPDLNPSGVKIIKRDVRCASMRPSRKD